MLSQVVELIESKHRFAITSHKRPDGDSLGSSLALYWVLRALNKDVVVFMRDVVPHAYSKLPGAADVVTGPEFETQYDAVFVMECSDIDRPGLIGLEKQFVVNIDHHSTTVLFGSINWIDSTASAVGEMIYNLSKALGVTVTKEIAECAYAALLTDTGSFHFSNTTERTFKVASELVRKGVEPAQIAQSIFYSNRYSKIKLLGLALSTMQCDKSGRIAWITLMQDAMNETGASEDEADGIVNYPLSVSEIEVVIFLKQIKNDEFRVSLRSKGKLNVAKIAEGYKGGGHRNAAGCTLTGPLDDIVQQLVGKVHTALYGGIMPNVTNGSGEINLNGNELI
jgi:phosphoesterase RecJ-like protein